MQLRNQSMQPFAEVATLANDSEYPENLQKNSKSATKFPNQTYKRIKLFNSLEIIP